MTAVRLGVLADVHGNLAALDAVLSRLAAAGVDRYVCAGDLVGYGPFPNECVRRLADLGATTVAGNHDLIALGRLGFERCGRLARQTLEWTRGVLDDDTRALLDALPLRADPVPGLVIAHGGLGDPQRYVRTADEARAELAQLEAGATLVLGHTHQAFAVGETRDELTGATVRLEPGERMLLNPGAVGQSRTRDPRTRALLLDLESRTAEFLAIDYDATATRDALRAAGLPAHAHHVPPARFPGEYRLRRLLDR